MAAMEWRRLGGSVKQIVVLEPAHDGGFSPTVVYKKGTRSGKKKGMRSLRVPEKLTRRLVRAQRTLTDVYLARHGRSNRKKKDGWLRDLGINLAKANQKASRKLSLGRLF